MSMEGVQECVALALSGKCTADKLLAFHRLNGLLASAPTFTKSQELADAVLSAAAAHSKATAAAQPDASTGGGQSPKAGAKGAKSPKGKGGARPVKPAGPLLLLKSLVELVGSGEPTSLIPISCLTALCSSSEAQQLMVEARLVPLLVGSLLAGGPNLEPLLLAASLQLLLALLAGDASRRAMLAEAGPVARVALSAMGSQQQQVRPLGLKLLQEVMLSGKAVRAEEALLREGLQKAVEKEQDPHTKAQLQQAQRLVDVLCGQPLKP